MFGVRVRMDFNSNPEYMCLDFIPCIRRPALLHLSSIQDDGGYPYSRAKYARHQYPCPRLDNKPHAYQTGKHAAPCVVHPGIYPARDYQPIEYRHLSILRCNFELVEHPKFEWCNPILRRYQIVPSDAAEIQPPFSSLSLELI